jgi:type I restriction enzyme S subunit
LLTKGIGHAEFKDSALGKIPKSWEVVKISKVAHINNSSLPNTTDEKYEFYYIDLSSVKSGKIETPLEKIKYSDSPSRARRILKRGDVIMATVRPNLLGFAFAGFDTNNYVCSTGFALLSHKENSNGQFIYQNLYSESVKSQINKLIVGSNYPAINSSDVKNIRIPFPSLNEQNQIAEVLFTTDEKLEVLSEKKATYQEMKQGLMQQLLTGKVRVKV